MKKPILVALIAATALAPLAASAQEWRGRGNRGGGEARAERPQGEAPQRPSFNRGGDTNGGGWQRQRAERPAGTEGQRGGFDRSQWQARRAERQAQAPQAVAQPSPQQAAPVQRQRGDWNRGDGNRGNWNRGDRTQQTQNRTVTPQQYFGNRIANGQAGQRDWNRERTDAQRRDLNRNDAQRRDWDRNNDGRRDWNRNDAQRRDWNRNDNRRSDWNRGSRWSRDWRSDRRYDWQGWRNQNRNAYRLPRYYAPRGYNYGYQRFSIGVTLGSILYARNYWISDPWQYRLPPVDYPLEWVRYYNDALLVDIETGEVVDVINDIFW